MEGLGGGEGLRISIKAEEYCYRCSDLFVLV
jgi:hypothetical protein